MSSIDLERNLVRLDATMLSGQSGGPAVKACVNVSGVQEYAVTALCMRSIKGELGDAR